MTVRLWTAAAVGMMALLVGCTKGPGVDVPTSWEKICVDQYTDKSVAFTGHAVGINRVDTKSINFEVASATNDSSTVTVNVDKVPGRKNTANFSGTTPVGHAVDSFVLNDGTTVLNATSSMFKFHGVVVSVGGKGKSCFVNVYRIEAVK